VHNATETSLVLDDAVWHLHLSAQGGQEQNDLNGIDITGNDNQLRFLLLDEGGDGVDSVADNWWPLGSLGFFVLAVLGLLLSTLTETTGLLLLSLWTVLVQKLEQLGGCLLVQSLGELVDWWRDLQPGLQNGLLPLEADILGPFDKVAQVPLGLDVLADAESLGALLEEWVDHALDLWLLDSQRGGCDLLSLLTLLVNHDEDSRENL